MPLSDQEWKGQITERLRSLEARLDAEVRAMERRFEAHETRAGVLGDGLTGLRVDMSAMRSEQTDMRGDIRDLTGTIKEDTRTRAKERREELNNIRQKGFSRSQIILAAICSFAVAVIGPLMVLAVTGKLG